MARGVQFIVANLFIIPFSVSVIHSIQPASEGSRRQENHAPAVAITSPKNDGKYTWNTAMNYTISVSDKEDGESKFSEIASNEVFLQVRYLADTSKLTGFLKGGNAEPSGLAAMRSSNCLNCHAFKGKLIGPSFYDINKRYPSSKANGELLVKRIQEGSTGIWGDVTMPTHPELTKEEMNEMVNWIFRNGAEPGVNYYTGTEGTFRMEAPAGPAAKGLLVLTASYTDHGVNDDAKKRLRGADVIVLRPQ